MNHKKLKLLLNRRTKYEIIFSENEVATDEGKLYSGGELPGNEATGRPHEGYKVREILGSKPCFLGVLLDGSAVVTTAVAGKITAVSLQRGLCWYQGENPDSHHGWLLPGKREDWQEILREFPHFCID